MKSPPPSIHLTTSIGTLKLTPSTPDALREAREKVIHAEELRKQRKLESAETICNELVQQYPDYFAALHTLGLVCTEKGDYTRAVGFLFRAAALNPRSWLTLTALSGVCLLLDAREMAASTLEQALKIKPNDADILISLGEVYSEEREYELARGAWHQAAELEPHRDAALIGWGRALAFLGQNGEAAAVFEQLIKRGARSLGVLIPLVDLPVPLVNIDILSILSEVKRDSNQDAADFENSLSFVRAAAFDKLGKFEEAWQQLRQANELIAVGLKSEIATAAERQRNSLKYLKESTPSSIQPFGRADLPISLFVLGPSRSGKTTMEMLVSSLPGVKRGYENPSTENAVRRTFQDSGLLTKHSLEHLPPQSYPLFRRIYIAEVIKRAGSAKVFTNTHPVYIHDAVRLASLVPNARFIFVKRNLEDISLRIYMRKYYRGNFYAYDLNAIREHVQWYYDMIDTLASKLPGITRIVQYEELVANPGEAMQIAADLCGLDIGKSIVPPEVGDDRGCAIPYRHLMNS